MSRLDELRKKIDEIDAIIIEKLAHREKVIHEIAKLKNVSDIQVLDSEREKQQMHVYERLSESYKINSKFIKEIFTKIHHHSRGLQK